MSLIRPLLFSLLSLFTLNLALACPPGVTTAHAGEDHHHHHGHSDAKAASSAGQSTYGKGVVATTKPIKLAEAMKQIDTLHDKEIVVEAKVDQVCQAMGCWMVLKDGKSQVRVTFDGYTVSKKLGKHTALVQGKLFVKDLEPAEARHYAKDEGRSAAEVAKITETVKTPWFEATGVKIASK